MFKTFQRDVIGAAVATFSLIFLISCENEKNSIYAETVADYEWEDENDDTFLNFTIKFVAEEGEGIAADGKPMKNRLIESHGTVIREKIKQKKSYKPGIKPLKHQKIRIKYEKKEPIMFYPLESLKYQDEQGQIIELN